MNQIVVAFRTGNRDEAQHLLSERINVLPGKRRINELALLFRMVGELRRPSSEQDPEWKRVLEGIAQTINLLTEDVRMTTYIATLNEVKLFRPEDLRLLRLPEHSGSERFLPEDQLSVLDTLVSQFEHLPPKSRILAFTNHVSSIRLLAPYTNVKGQLTSLIPQVDKLPRNEWPRAIKEALTASGLAGSELTDIFDILFRWAATRPSDEQGEVFAALAIHVGELEAEARPERYRQLEERQLALGYATIARSPNAYRSNITDTARADAGA